MRIILLIFICVLFNLPFISGQSTWTQLSAGGEFSIGLDIDGKVYTWGYNGSGQLGNGNSGNENVNMPTAILDTVACTEVQAGNFHGLALARDSSLWAWGYNGYGQVDPDSQEDIISVPVKVDTSQKWVDIYAGFNISFAVDTLGDLYVWGSNVHGEAGVGSDENEIRNLTKVNEGDRFKQISPGKYFTLALSIDGHIWGWGDNSMKTLTNSYGDEVNSAVRIDTSRIYEKVAASFNGSHALDLEGNVWSWGSNEYKESGVLDAPNVIDTLMKVGDSLDQNYIFTDLTCGGIQCFASEGSENDIYTWGTNNIWNFVNGKSESDTVIASTTVPNRYTLPMASKGLDDGLTIFGGHILMFERNSDFSTYCGVGPNYVGQIGGGMDRSKIEMIQCNLGSTSTSTVNGKSSNNITIYPNPAYDKAVVDAKGEIITRSQIISMQGEVLKDNKLRSEILTMNVADLSSGIYIVRLKTDQGKNITSKLIVK